MILGKLDQPTSYAILCQHPIWEEAFNWIKRFASVQPPGTVEIRQERMYANVHSYETRPRENCRYESHRVYVDLQYCISGGEIIEWCPVKVLTMENAYNVEKDVTHYQLPAQPEASFAMSAGSFAIFFPEDGHLPKVSDGRNPQVGKLVIKIDQALLLPGLTASSRPAC
jgi:YhcH/YjgK/YiaL family protein